MILNVFFILSNFYMYIPLADLLTSVRYFMVIYKNDPLFFHSIKFFYNCSGPFFINTFTNYFLNLYKNFLLEFLFKNAIKE